MEFCLWPCSTIIYQGSRNVLCFSFFSLCNNVGRDYSLVLPIRFLSLLKNFQSRNFQSRFKLSEKNSISRDRHGNMFVNKHFFLVQNVKSLPSMKWNLWKVKAVALSKNEKGAIQGDWVSLIELWRWFIVRRVWKVLILVYRSGL